jgi:hypothetical protein
MVLKRCGMCVRRWHRMILARQDHDKGGAAQQHSKNSTELTSPKGPHNNPLWKDLPVFFPLAHHDHEQGGRKPHNSM